ncbi:MAG: hypothetical protein PCFJNLEI_01793 [Verrucomicrobiae bacterium]|nr:hypothetical protein [Verrucomicrobiae bacterium]
MAEIQPFHGVLYNTARVNPADVLTQPYDKITPEMREAYLKRSPYNLVQIELGKEQPGDNDTTNKYSRARDLYQQWLKDGVLRRSNKPALYYLEQEFAAPDGSGRKTRTGLIARVRLHRWDEGVILPHEHTLSKPKADRMALLKAVGSQQGHIFMLYPKPAKPVLARPAGKPTLECVDDYSVTNRVWEITDPAAIAGAQAALRDLKFYIADGHHRYETALAYRDEMQTEAGKFVMATLVDMSDAGLVVLPTHRTIANLTGFDRQKFHAQLAPQFEITPQTKLSLTGHTIGMFDGQGYFTLRPKNPAALRPLFANKPPLWDTLDVAILHVAILEALLGIDEKRLAEEANVSYWREPEKAVAQVQAGKAQLAFFLTPTPVPDVKAIADARSRMPQKSTDFYPKLLSGMTIYEVR